MAVLVLGRTAVTAADGADPTTVRRILLLVATAGEEYREALDESGRVVRPLELDEARLLLSEAQQHTRRLPGALAADVEARITALTAAIDARGPLEDVSGRVEAIGGFLGEATGVTHELSPPAPPSAARGRAIFTANCTGCHGERGAGDGPDAAALVRKPADFTSSEFMRGETPNDFFHVISVGKRLGAMPAWQDSLSVQDRWDAVAYIWSLSLAPATLAEGQGLFVAHCAGCHGAAGDGRGILASGLGAPVPDLSTPLSLATRSDADLVTVVRDGAAGTAMPTFGRVLTDDERWKVVAFLRLLSLGGVERATEASPAAPAAAVPQADVLAEVRRLLGAAVEAHGRGDAAAADFATDAYLRFEPLEPHLRTRDGEIVPRLEEAFLAFRMAIARPGAGREVTEARARVEADLDRAGTLLASRTDAWARFVQSAAIILREGIEVVLIVGALLAYVRRSGNGAMARAIHAGTGLGIAASVASAALLVGLLRSRPAAAELIEGVAMLVAAGVLFWVSYWIISKAEAERWQRYIQGKVQHAVAAGSGVALAAAAFLAVYREGVETVLFYQALLGSAPAGDLAVGAGFVGGAAVLSVIYVLMSRFGLRIPMRPFFLVTGAFLYAMSVSFAGGGVHALQEAGVIGITPVPWVPTIPFLGVFPALEPLLAQGVLLACLAYAAFVTLRRRPTSDQHVLAAELGRLRAQAEAMRAEVAALRAVDGAASQGLDARLEGLIGRVRELEGRLPGNGRG